jgi:hypothetical protein
VQGSVSGLTRTVSGLQGATGQYNMCIPELQHEIGALNVSTSYQSLMLTNGSTNDFLISAYLTNPTVISTNCTKTLYGY